MNRIFVHKTKKKLLRFLLEAFQRQKGVEPSSSAWKAEIMSRYMTAARSASDWNRTNDRQIFSLLLYQLSYTGLLSCDGVKYIPL